jgi:hypothetical protein
LRCNMCHSLCRRLFIWCSHSSHHSIYFPPTL